MGCSFIVSRVSLPELYAGGGALILETLPVVAMFFQGLLGNCIAYGDIGGHFAVGVAESSE